MNTTAQSIGSFGPKPLSAAWTYPAAVASDTFSAMTKATKVFSTKSTRSVERESSATQTTGKGLASVMLASQWS
jgi:hypothetical protein